jgi:hypothetical protein
MPDKGYAHLHTYDVKRNKVRSAVKKYRELAMMVTLEPGRYMIVPR